MLARNVFPIDPAHSGDQLAPRTVNLSYIARALGVYGHYGDKRMVTYVRALIAAHGFPRPLPTLLKSRTTLEVVPTSHWLREAVDAWLEDFLPPDAAAALDRKAMAAAAADLDSAAASGLRIIRGGRS